MFAQPGRGTSSSQSCHWLSGSLSLRATRVSAALDSSIGFHRRAAAHQVAIAERAVDPAYRWPELVFSDGLGGIGRSLTRVGAVPGIRDDLFQRMRRVAQKIIRPVGPALFDLPDLASDRDQRVTEPVELLL